MTNITPALLIGALLLSACGGKEEEEEVDPLCTSMTIEVTVIDAGGLPLADAAVELDNVACEGDGTSNVYTCSAIQNEAGRYQIVILHPNANAYSQLLPLPAPEAWCDTPVYQHSAQLGAMMGS